MQVFAIKVIDPMVRECYQMPCCIGEIQIGEFKETFEMPLEYWGEDYEKQWKEGLERLKAHNQSCLVVEVQDPKKAPRASVWALYKDGETVHIQNKLLFSKRFADMLKKEPFTLETCYNFINPRTILSDTGMKISERAV